MKTLIATLLATAAGASFAAAPTFGLNHDPATYRNVSQKGEADYKAAVAKCEGTRGNDKDVCMAEAKVVRTRTEVDALARYNNSPRGREKMRTEMADAEYDLAKARCGAKSGAEKDDCVNNAKSVHTAALAEAKAGASVTTGNAANNAANNTSSNATGASTGGATEAADSAAAKTRDAAAVAADNTKAAAATTVEKTKEATANLTEKTADATAKTRIVAADTAITTKVKAGLVKEPDLSSLGIHVETEKGVVMLSGFVRSKTEAEKAVKVAKNVDGVSNVKSAILVK
jgi:hyperosmotically inducible protein